MKLLSRALAFACALLVLPSLAAAQTAVLNAPSSIVPLAGCSFGTYGAAATSCSATNPLPVGGGDPSTATATISNGGSLSAAVDLANQRLHRIVMPSGWTSAAITFQSSPDGVTYADLYNESGEYSISSSVAGASRAIVVDQSLFYGIRYLKIRSGTTAAGVNQGAQRDLTLVTVPR